MKLFEEKVDKEKNWLPYDGVVNYYSDACSEKEADRFYNSLFQEIDWGHDRLFLFGKEIVTRRKVAWYGDRPFEYTYSSVKKTALFWTQELLELKGLVECCTGKVFNSCLLNLYHDGVDGMGWHSDDEKELVKNAAIASLSFGAQRKFVFKHKISKEKIDVVLDNGSLLLMSGETQEHWLHQLPKTKRVNRPRINLTFRSVVC